MKRKIQKISFDRITDVSNNGRTNLTIDSLFRQTLGVDGRIIFYYDKNLIERQERQLEIDISNANEKIKEIDAGANIFLFIPNKTPALSNIIEYEFPFINFRETNFEKIDFFRAFYWNNIDSGLIIIDKQSFTFIENIEGNFNDFMHNYYFGELRNEIERYKNLLKNSRNRIWFSISQDFDKSDIEERKESEVLDPQTAKIIKEISTKINDLKKNPNFYLVAPVISRILRENSDFTPVSRLIVAKDYKIILPDYNNIEIQLSHLTKAIFLLFLKHPEGIARDNYINHKNELLEIYKSITYQNSYSKIVNTIDKLFADNGKDFSVHFSRIKSAFEQKFTHLLACHYTVQVFGKSPRKISLDRNLVIWETEI